MKTFLWVNLYAILVGTGCYIGGVLTGGVIRTIVEDIWILIKGSVLTIAEVLGKIFGRQ